MRVMAKKRVHIYISGMVQGVCFRAYTRDMAYQFKLSGWVKNLHDGRVEAVFEGDKENVDMMIDWCKKGPRGASVSNVEVTEESYSGSFDGFSVEFF